MKKVYFLILLVAIMTSLNTLAQDERTVGLFVNEDAAYEGYVLYSPQRNPELFLIDNEARVIKQWTFDDLVREAFMLDNGNIVVLLGIEAQDLDTTYMPESFLNGSTGRIIEMTWEGEIVWEYELIDPKLRAHHGVSVLPNGNMMLIAWSYRSIDEAIAMGLDGEAYGDEYDLLLPDAIVEIDRETKEIVWQWDSWDHLVQNFDPDKPNYGEPSDFPGRIDLNYHEQIVKGIETATERADWMHSNAIAYNPELDQVLLSARSFDEVWFIDHSTTTEEAAGPAGDLLYRWGNPAAYGQGELEERFFYNQHDLQWIEPGYLGEGNILAYNNREVDENGEEYSAIIEFTPPLNEDGSYNMIEGTGHYGPEELIWHYASEGFFSAVISSVQRLPNGNTFINQGRSGRLFEVTPEGEIVWDYVNPSITNSQLLEQGSLPTEFNNRIFRARKYGADYVGFEGRDLTPGEPLVE